VLAAAALEKNTACFGNKGVQILFVKAGPVSNRTIPIKSGSTVLILLFHLKRSRVCNCSKASFSCFLSTSYENSLLSFLFFTTGVERIAAKMELITAVNSRHFGAIIQWTKRVISLQKFRLSLKSRLVVCLCVARRQAAESSCSSKDGRLSSYL